MLFLPPSSYWGPPTSTAYNIYKSSTAEHFYEGRKLLLSLSYDPLVVESISEKRKKKNLLARLQDPPSGLNLISGVIIYRCCQCIQGSLFNPEGYYQITFQKGDTEVCSVNVSVCPARCAEWLLNAQRRRPKKNLLRGWLINRCPFFFLLLTFTSSCQFVKPLDRFLPTSKEMPLPPGF